MTALTTPSDVAHEYTYNAVNLDTEYLTPLSGAYGDEYDRDRRLTRIVMPSGKTIDRIYANDQLLRVETPEGDVEYTYEPCGSKVSSVSKDGESISYAYDGPLTVSRDSAGALNLSLGYEYNDDFRLESFTYAGDATAFTRDNDGLLTGAGAFTITRNAENGLVEAVGDGVSSRSNVFTQYGEIEGWTVDVDGGEAASYQAVEKFPLASLLRNSQTLAYVNTRRS